jgi:hypothetical protein
VTIPVNDQEPVKVEGVGYSGPGCAKDIAAILDVLGGESERRNKTEYYQAEKIKEKARA